jgi:DNA polymerase I-like protein with 3'-5' exonuclease and polymerase domains
MGKRVSLITLDFETYYAEGFGFKNLTTEEYIRDKQFEEIGVGVKVDDSLAYWISGSHEELKKHLTDLTDWSDSALLCHNTLFDGAILGWRFGIYPAFYLDTLCMARALHGVDAGGSLGALAERYQIGVKGDEVVKALGKRRADFTPAQLSAYGDYCKNDVELTYKLFHLMAAQFPGDEVKLIDMTLRMFLDPVFQVDDALLVQRLEDLKAEKNALLATLKKDLECEDEEAVRKKLASNKKFAAILEGLDPPVTPPKKISPVTGKETFALAKNDEGFIALTQHENPLVQQLCAVRLGTKSTLEESRITRFIDIGKRNRGLLPIPLKYYGAHTGRWSGSDKVNFQNLPSRDKKKKTLKNAVLPPDGHVVINCDSSQIEARVLAWLAGQGDVVQQFASGEDVYSIFASKVYSRTITKANPEERFVGKTCVLGLGYGTGWKKLQHTLATSQPISVALPDDECQAIVNLYREVNDNIISLWKECDDALGELANWDAKSKPFYLGQHKALQVTQEGIALPNGLMIRYPKLRFDTEGEKSQFKYKSRKGEIGIWGGAVVENVVQALARIVVGEQMLAINERYRVALTVHDAAVIVVPESEREEAMAFITEKMSIAPDWAAGLPVACEAKWGHSYGEC